jgi:acylphosphatase
MRAISLKIKGKVQKVWYRQSTLQEAEILEVKGFVMNTHNDEVYIEAEAEDHILDKFVQWCENGPELAQVENIERKEIEFKGFNNFQVVY